MESKFIPMSISAEQLKEYVQKCFNPQEVFAMISALTNAVKYLKEKRVHGLTDHEIKDLFEKTISALAKLIGSLPPELKAQCLEGLNELGFEFSVEEVTIKENVHPIGTKLQ